MRKFVASVSALVLAAAVLSACGGGGGSSNSDNPSPPSNNGGGDASDKNLSSLVANANKQKFKLTFTLGSGEPQVYAQDGKGNTVLSSSDAETFTTKTDTITCDKSSGSYQCDSSPGASGDANNPFLGVVTLEQTQLTALGGRFGTTSTKRILGRAARCVTFDASELIQTGDETTVAGPPTVKGSYAYCIDASTGATLQVSTTDSSGKRTSVLLVTKFESPKASDFTPPAAPSVPSVPAS